MVRLDSSPSQANREKPLKYIINSLTQLIGAEAFDSSRDQSHILNSSIQAPTQPTTTMHQMHMQNRPPVPKLKIKKPTLFNTSQPVLQNFINPSSTLRERPPPAHNTSTNQSFIFSFGGNSPSIHLRGSGGYKSMTPNHNSSLMNLDFYGRRSSGKQIRRQDSYDAGDNVGSQNKFQDSIEFELRSQLEGAKKDLSQMHKDLEVKIKKEIQKHPGFANEESILIERVNELQNKFELFEDEITRRTKDLMRGLKNLKKDQLTAQKRISDTVTSKELEIVVDLTRGDFEEKFLQNKEEVATLKQIVKAQRFEIENELLKKTKAQQSEHEKKLEDFFKFKADVYSYLDGKFENLNNTYHKKFESIFEFMDIADDKLRSIQDLKDQNDFKFEDFKNKYTQKQKILEDTVNQSSHKTSLFENKLKDYQGYLMRVKNAVQEIKQDNNYKSLNQRMEILEKKINDEDFQSFLTLQIDQLIKERLQELELSSEVKIKEVEKRVMDMDKHYGKNLKSHSERIDILIHDLDKLKSREELVSIQNEFNLKIEIHEQQLKKLKDLFELKQKETEESFIKSFNDIRQIVLQKVQVQEKRIAQSEKDFEVITQKVEEVTIKYEHFQELFTNLIQEMQASEDENESHSQPKQHTVPVSPLPSLPLSEEKINSTEDYYNTDKSRNVKSKSRKQPTVIKSIRQIQEEKKSHIQNTTSEQTTNSNRIFKENSPERKSHDNMLLSSHKKSRVKQEVMEYAGFKDEANVVDKINSEKVISNEMYNEVQIAKSEKQIKAYSQKFYENQEKDDDSYSIHEIELETERDQARDSDVQDQNSSSYTLDLVDASLQSLQAKKASPRWGDQQKDSKEQPNMHKQKSFNKLLSDEDMHDLYDYSPDEDQDEEVHPFERSQESTPQKQQISVIDAQSTLFGFSNIKPKESLELSPGAQKKQNNFSNYQQMSRNKGKKEHLEVQEDEEKNTSHSQITPLANKIILDDQFEMKVQPAKQVDKDLQSQYERIEFELCADFVAREIAQMLRFTINRNKHHK